MSQAETGFLTPKSWGGMSVDFETSSLPSEFFTEVTTDDEEGSIITAKHKWPVERRATFKDVAVSKGMSAPAFIPGGGFLPSVTTEVLQRQRSSGIARRKLMLTTEFDSRGVYCPQPRLMRLVSRNAAPEELIQEQDRLRKETKSGASIDRSVHDRTSVKDEEAPLSTHEDEEDLVTLKVPSRGGSVRVSVGHTRVPEDDDKRSLAQKPAKVKAVVTKMTTTHKGVNKMKKAPKRGMDPKEAAALDARQKKLLDIGVHNTYQEFLHKLDKFSMKYLFNTPARERAADLNAAAAAEPMALVVPTKLEPRKDDKDHPEDTIDVSVHRRGKDTKSQVKLIDDLSSSRRKRRVQYEKQQKEIRRRQPRSLMVLKRLINSNTESNAEYESKLLMKAKEAHLHRMLHVEEFARQNLDKRIHTFYESTQEFIRDCKDAKFYTKEPISGYVVNAKLPTIVSKKKKPTQATKSSEPSGDSRK